MNQSADTQEEQTLETQPAESATATQLVVVAKLRRQLADLMRIDDHAVTKPPDEVVTFIGHVYDDTEAAFELMTERLAEQGYTVMLQDEPEGKHRVIAVKGTFERKEGKVWGNAVLFLATALCTLFVGAATDLGYSGELIGLNDQQAMDVIFSHLQRGIPFAATILSILATHELSHYFVARRYGSPVSLPYFIPFPNLLGTMGAVIVQRAPMRSRKTLFDIGVAGPLGGLIVAVPLLALGLALSTVQPPPAGVDGVFQEGNSLLYAGLKYLIFGRFLPINGEDVWLHPIASAAWGGLLVTMINLIPVGQLDGGHVSYALLGRRRAQMLGYTAITAMIAWGGWLWMDGNQAGSFWLMWGVMNMVLNPRHPPPLDDASKLDWRRIALGLAMLIIFILLFMPAPLQEIQL